jgi:hypothetical protein
MKNDTEISEGMRQCKWLRRYTRITSRNVEDSVPYKVTENVNWPNPSNRTMDLVSIKSLTEMRPGIFKGVRVRLMRKADNLTAICEPIV